ncbi:MAG: 4-hydroxy-tetrahydrodipicolinate reductase [Pseudanabaenaceae cyanobacterium SKYGB_i_bin29]|nr:4-hydroxy-tetrahydrodipicolinate reductase [Pseudanabaenaceae cyanobacterium SKYG29]MDW8420649.1 4-hydroxy-tetrahydrodipicolinate reductase [Pseudanabaenaceae cyanobacterium SKYGB_i_bin29]
MATDLPIPVIVAGATGKMGRTVIKAIAQRRDLVLIGATGRTHLGEDIGEVVGIGALEVPVTSDLQVLLAQGAQEQQYAVMVDFTHPGVVYDHVRSAIAYGVRPVVGTTGLTEAQIQDLAEFADKASVGAIIAPNFSIGMILLQQAAVAASQFYDYVEIIELHHEQKADAPSGTAIKTAQMLSELGKTFNPRLETEGRGKVVGENIPIHSVRLPGLVAHQEVIFGSAGETYSLRHNVIDRACYMPGVILAIRKVITLQSLVYGLEKIL